MRTLETTGNATLVFSVDGRPVLATDPWLVGTCYFGGWAHDHPLTEAEKRRVIEAPYLWISHGHPDHLHHDPLALVPRDKTLLVPDHYDREIKQGLADRGFVVEILTYRQWRDLAPGRRCLCLDNDNQDAILVVEMGDVLVVNLNDSPLCGEGGFLRRLIRRYDREKTYLAALCAVDADMINIVDAEGPAHHRSARAAQAWRDLGSSPQGGPAGCREFRLLFFPACLCPRGQHLGERLPGNLG